MPHLKAVRLEILRSEICWQYQQHSIRRAKQAASHALRRQCPLGRSWACTMAGARQDTEGWLDCSPGLRTAFNSEGKVSEEDFTLSQNGYGYLYIYIYIHTYNIQPQLIRVRGHVYIWLYMATYGHIWIYIYIWLII